MQLENKVSLKKLYQIVLQTDAIRCGSTNDPKRRKNEYSEFEGIMYYAQSKDMRRNENTLLGLKNWPENVHRQSNSKNTEGYVYVIVGYRV